jgi:hypothetical protein
MFRSPLQIGIAAVFCEKPAEKLPLRDEVRQALSYAEAKGYGVLFPEY